MRPEVQNVTEQISRLEDLLSSINRSTSCNFSSNDCKLQFQALRARPAIEGALKLLRREKRELLVQKQQD